MIVMKIMFQDILCSFFLHTSTKTKCAQNPVKKYQGVFVIFYSSTQEEKKLKTLEEK